MTMFPINHYDKSFLSPNSAKPIVGVVANTAFKRPLLQAKVKEDGFTQGQPVVVKNLGMYGHMNDNAGQGLAPNVLMAEKITTIISGFVVESPNMVYIDGEEGAQALANQVVYVALLGSGAEMYLPVKNDVTNIDVVNEQLCWNIAEKYIEKGAGDASTKLALAGVSVLSMPVAGLQFYYDDTKKKVKSKEINVIKIKL